MYLRTRCVLNRFRPGQPERGAGAGCWCSLRLPECCLLLWMAGHGYRSVCFVCTCAHMPRNWMDMGTWCCSSFSFLRLLDSATSSIDKSHVFSNSILCIFKQHYGFCVGGDFLSDLDEVLTFFSLQMNNLNVLHSLLVTLNKTRSQNYFLPK